MKTTLLILSIFTTTLTFGQQIITAGGKDYDTKTGHIMDSNYVKSKVQNTETTIQSLRQQINQLHIDDSIYSGYMKRHGWKLNTNHPFKHKH